MSRGLRDRFPYPYTRADGEAFLAGRVLAPGTLNLAIEIDGQACGSVGAQQGVAERGTPPNWATGWARRIGARA